MEKLKQNIVRFIEGLGLDTFGFTDCRKFEELRSMFQYRKVNDIENAFEEKDIEKRINPFLYMEEGKTIISIAFPYLYRREVQGDIFFSKYTQGEDYHEVLKVYLNKICEYIQNLGGKALYFIDSNALPERYIAKLCGVGYVGKNSMLITKKYGSYVFLGEIVTSLKLEPSTDIEAMNCGSCTACIKMCPSLALIEGGKTSYSSEVCCEPNLCLSYISQEKIIEDKWLLKLGGRLFGCDTCQSVCPKNIKVQYSEIEKFEPKEYMENPNIEELIYLSNNIFLKKYKGTSCGWRGKNILQRNVILNQALIESINKIRLKEIKSDYVKEYYNRLLHLMNL